MGKYTKMLDKQQAKMEKAQGQFEDWRRNRTKRTRIPEKLWKTAIGLYPEYSICQIAKALRLDYSKLKKKILYSNQEGSKKPESKIEKVLNASKKERKNPESKIEKIQKEFEDWRKNRTKPFIPEALWEKAIELYPEYGIYKIAETLRLNYKRLKCRLLQLINEGAASKPDPDRPRKLKTSHIIDKESPPPEFIQFDIQRPASYQNEWSIDLGNSNGSKIKISVKSSAMPDFTSILQNFLEGDF